MEKIKALEAQEKLNKIAKESGKTLKKTMSAGVEGAKKSGKTLKRCTSEGGQAVKKIVAKTSPKPTKKKMIRIEEKKEDPSAELPSPRISLAQSFRDSMSGHDSSMFGTDDEIEAQIRKAMGLPASDEGGRDSMSSLSDKAKAKASRKARMSVRMSTRADAMNANRRTSTLNSSQTKAGKRMSTRMSVRTGRMSTRMSVSRRGSGGFVMLKDLEERDEFNKVQAQNFLRELAQLAENESKESLKKTIKRKQSGKGNANAGGDPADGSIHLQDIDLTSLTKEKAKETIAALHSGEKIDGDSLMALIQAGVQVLGAEETVLDLRKFHSDLESVTAVGDLHGSLECLMEVLNLVNVETLTGGSVVVFDGDFVDRGNNSLEVIATLLLLKLSHPKNVILLRGNHEDSMTASSYGFRDEVDEKYGYDKGDEIWWEFGLLFAAFPIAARTNQAAIMHGGIPVEEFTLDDLNELEPATRCEMKTVTDPYDDDERLLQGIMWSDPSEEEGINFSDRGAGFTFGPDITKDFLERHDLKYIIRAHEVVESGHCHHDVGDGKGVATIFSSANYPAGEGTNHGAVMFLNDKTGEYSIKDFIHIEDGESNDSKVFKAFLESFVDGHASQLIEAFKEVENGNGHVNCEQWADTIAELLELPDTILTWLEYQPELAPTVDGGDMIDWKAFLKKFSFVTEKDAAAKNKQNLNMITTVFKYLDANSDGVLDEDEFKKGFDAANARMPERNKFGSHDDWYRLFETNDDNKIDLTCFKAMFCAI